MMMMEKNRFGVNVMVFVFLLSLLAPCASIQNDFESDDDFSTIQEIEERGGTGSAVDVSGVFYFRKSIRQLEMELNTITAAKGQRQYFYIGVASRLEDAKSTTIQALCFRQDKNTRIDPQADKCGGKSTHHKDIDAKHCGLKLTKVFYTGAFKSKTEVCGTEKSLIAKYYNNCKVDPLCLNRAPGTDKKCIQATEGIVYLRIYNPI